MRVDFYQLSRDTVEKVVPMLARKVCESGERLLIVSHEHAQLEAIAEGLWAESEAFLANGLAVEPHAARQPILLSDSCSAANEAKMVLMADGAWREEARRFDRVFLMFGDATIEAARGLWRELGEAEDIERNFWKQEAGRWIKAA